MGEQIKRSTIHYVQKQRISLAKSMVAGNPTRAHARHLYAVEAAMCDLENRFFDDLAHLRDLIPLEYRTRKRLARAHAMITRLECNVEAKHADEHRRHPTRSYLALVSDDLADEVSQALYQPWARLAKVQPRVGPTRARQDPTKARPQWTSRGYTSLALDWPRSSQGLG